MRLRLLRSATLIVEYADRSILFDPMLGAQEAMDPVANAARSERIPLVPLPVDEPELERLLDGLDGVIVSHTHRDHWDAAAIDRVPRSLPLFCQPVDAATITGQGFQDVRPVDDVAEWGDIRLTRADGHHGTGEIGRMMGPVSGFILQAEGEPTLYLAGDTIWCPEVAAAIRQHRPRMTVVHACAAQFLTGDPIIMTASDVLAVAAADPGMTVVATHMETVNHCQLTRAELRAALTEAGNGDRVLIPLDGDVLSLNA